MLDAVLVWFRRDLRDADAFFAEIKRQYRSLPLR